jgi:hypothetical protein
VLARCKWIDIKYEVKTLMVKAKILQMAFLIGIAAPAWGQSISEPDVPITIRVPVDQEAVLTAHATGSQIYVSQPRGMAKRLPPIWLLPARRWAGEYPIIRLAVSCVANPGLESLC